MESYIALFAKVADETLLGLSLKNKNMSCELSSALYNYLLSGIFDSISMKTSRDTAQSLVDFLNEKALLRAFRAPNEFLNYEIPTTDDIQ